MFHLLNYCASDLDLVQLSLDFITDDLILACEYYIGVCSCSDWSDDSRN